MYTMHSQVVKGQKLMEGAGVRICRTLGTGALRNLDPFLMLDELKMPAHQAAAGFPNHPVRLTCNYLMFLAPPALSPCLPDQCKFPLTPIKFLFQLSCLQLVSHDVPTFILRYSIDDSI